MAATPTRSSADSALFNPQSGRLDAARVACELNLPVVTIAEAIGQTATAVQKNPDAATLQGELRRLYAIWVSLVDLYAGNKDNARVFLNAPNRHLENRAPVEFIGQGNLAPLESFVDAMISRQPV